MHYLIYVSQATKPMSTAELSEILEKSRTYNDKDGITGLLVYKYNPDDHRGNFMQLLEGPEEAVRSAFKRICDDKRHHTKIMLEDGVIAERNFADWSMGFKAVDQDTLREIMGFADLGDESFQNRAREGEVSGALELMKSFYEDDD